MITKGASFARYSRNLCWFVAFIWLLLAVLTFTGDSVNSVLNGFLWLAGSIAFAISAIFIGRSNTPDTSSDDDLTSE